MRDLFERLLAFTRDAVYRYRFSDGVILMANQGLVDVLDLDCKGEDLVGRRLRDVLVYTEKEGTVREAIKEEGEVHGFEYHFRTLKGEDRWVLHDSFVVTDAGTGEKVVEAIAKDITDRKHKELTLRQLNEELERRVRRRTEELEAANKELAAFAYSVSHDLRAPLRHIEGFSRILLEDCAGQLDAACQDHLNRIQSAARRLGKLIDALLKLSRLTRGEMHYGPLDLSAMAGEIAREIQEADPGRKGEFVIEPGLTDEGDATLMRVALYNLLANAWKFSSMRPEPRIEVGATRGPDGLTYFVRDNGVGFDMAYVHKLFEPFQRLHSSDEFPGTGIGLVSVHRIIARHGGKVWTEGDVDRGATFYFTLGRR